MAEISKADVYRRAAEVIVRDGKHEKTFVEGWAPTPTPRPAPAEMETGWPALRRAIKDRSRPVCALGACLRAEYELTGTLTFGRSDGDHVYEQYSFDVRADSLLPGGAERDIEIWQYNDRDRISAEDIALELKRRAEEIDG
jgi:hypothetical protein